MATFKIKRKTVIVVAAIVGTMFICFLGGWKPAAVFAAILFVGFSLKRRGTNIPPAPKTAPAPTTQAASAAPPASSKTKDWWTSKGANFAVYIVAIFVAVAIYKWYIIPKWRENQNWWMTHNTDAVYADVMSSARHPGTRTQLVLGDITSDTVTVSPDRPVDLIYEPVLGQLNLKVDWTLLDNDPTCILVKVPGEGEPYRDCPNQNLNLPGRQMMVTLESMSGKTRKLLVRVYKPVHKQPHIG